MANVFAPTGLVYSYNKLGAAPNYQAQLCYIQSGYSTSIPVGSVVVSTGGYITLAGDNPSRITGMFAGVLPYYDTTLQGTSHGRNGAWVASAASNASVPCLVVTDPMAVFRIQCSGIAPAATWPGLNINWIAGTNATLSTSGISVLAADSSTPATTNTFPFVIEGLAGVPGGPQDPTVANPWINVRFNPGIHTALLALGA
jgi:hypothetical protein